jgi:hypothetical protein
MVNMTPRNAFEKCRDENHRIPRLEKIIITDPEYSYRYASDVINGRWEEAEKIILTDAYSSYRYACHIINGRWEEAESSIATNSQYSYLYALYVIHGPFHLCHHFIFNSKWKDDYIDFLKSINYDFNEISEWLI